MEIKPGDKAPEFTLRASDKSQIHLKDYRGKNVLLLFFPLAFTGVCTKELQEMNASLAEYEKLNTQLLAVSVDSIYALERWKHDLGFDFPMLSDFNKTVSRKYGCLYKDFVFEMKGVSKRSAFVIDKEGTIRYAEVLENAGELPDFLAIRKILEELDG
ncbi:MAG: redoxin domain-containing protein [Bacteroidetes bacterium]|nr:MAG: redoxin domain-containing protein [Bacteroidota bacterium]